MKKQRLRYDLLTYVRQGIFQFIWGSVKYIPSPIGEPIGFLVLKLFAKKISTMWIRSGITIWWPDRISIGRSSLNEDIHLNGYGGIDIGNRVLIGHRCTFFSDEHQFDDPDQLIWFQGRLPAPITVGDDVYFGCNVIVLAGAQIGSGAVIGAGSVVNADIPPFAIAAGVPARIIGYRGAPKLRSLKDNQKKGCECVNSDVKDAAFFCSSGQMDGADNYNNWTFDLFAGYLRGNVLEVGCGVGSLPNE